MSADGVTADGVTGGARGTPAGDAWNPGLGSEIPRRLQPQVTLFRPENASRDAAEAHELADLSGLAVTELAVLRPERLVVHELLVRVTADLSVTDGPSYEELGINLRGMVATLLERHVGPEMARLREAFEAERERAGAFIDDELVASLPGPGEARGDLAEEAGEAGASRSGSPGSWLGRLFGRRSPAATGSAPRRATPAATAPRALPEIEARDAWRARLGSCDSPLEHACLEALVKTVDGIVGRHGRLFADRALVRKIALGLIVNGHGARLVGEWLEPVLERAIAHEGYRPLPTQRSPTIMNVKGASASGKSTIRPRQRRLAEQLGIPWEDFALISPDYWRKYLLDYDSLGEDFKYGAMLTGQELEIIDRKLDRHMAAKASRGAMSHLLIDRFRFDSFVLDKDRTADSRLLTRFGSRVYLFFVVTPPAATVERAWIRGRRTGRYKAVSDLLYHNVEAYTGMPALFLSWVCSDEREVHFEFLDNDVPEGSLPRTAAFGRNDAMTILDVAAMLAIDRYRRVNVEAHGPDEVLEPADPERGRTPEFVRRCAERIATIDFADRDSAHVYARVVGGALAWWDEGYVERLPPAGDVARVLEALGRGSGRVVDPDARPAPIDVPAERRLTVGRWGEDAAGGDEGRGGDGDDGGEGDGDEGDDDAEGAEGAEGGEGDGDEGDDDAEGGEGDGGDRGEGGGGEGGTAGRART